MVMMVGFAAFLSVLFFWPVAAIVTVIGLTPTIVYWFVDTHTYRGLRLKTIFFFNLAGVVPYAYKSLNSNGLDGVGVVLADGSAIMTMLGAGALGVIVLGIAPNIAVMFIQMSSNEQVRKMEAQQKKLLDIWGGEIINENSTFYEDHPKPK